MSDPRLRLHAPRAARMAEYPPRPLGRHLVDSGVLRPADLVHALELQMRIDAPLGEILMAEGLASQAQVLDAVAGQHGVYVADLEQEPPDPALTDLMSSEFWLRHRIIPWMRMGRTLIIATARPDRLDKIRAELPTSLGEVLTVVAPEQQIMTALASRFSDHLSQLAETRVARRFSCRKWQAAGSRPLWLTALAVALGGAAATLAPAFVFGAVNVIAVLSLFCITGLKLAGFCAQVLANLPDTDRRRRPDADPVRRMPRISVMVPLFHETEIAGALVRRLARLSYPKALLDVVLVLEEKDNVTRDALVGASLPPWMRVVEVPDSGGLTTKPRALNYALDFCRGDIIGIWDAEDAPEPDQLERVAAHFARADDDVICLQGILDYYNPRTNWLARCFTIEYASWWRVILPGLARLGLVIPLGGTTCFFKRRPLEALGGWDAHNVTEDADLGVRLARAGYRTELIHSVTHEEANCRAWPWIKQRSRWLKGFMVTYLVHMRRPLALLRDLGWRRFLGLQAFFVGTLSQFLFAPVLWSFWLVILGLSHPARDVLPGGVLVLLCGLFLLTEITNIVIGCVAVSGRAHRSLMGWVPTLMFYFPLGALASYKAVYELFLRPFYWDKTQHGQAPSQMVIDIKAPDNDPLYPDFSLSFASLRKRVMKATEM